MSEAVKSRMITHQRRALETPEETPPDGSNDGTDWRARVTGKITREKRRAAYLNWKWAGRAIHSNVSGCVIGLCRQVFGTTALRAIGEPALTLRASEDIVS